MGCDKCCSFPNGFLTLVPCVLSIVAYVLSSINLWSCQYAETPSGIGLGLIRRETTWFDDSYGEGYCTSYFFSSLDGTTDLVDGTFRAAQALGSTVFVVGFIMCIVVWGVAPCTEAKRIGWRMIGGLFFLLGLFQALTLMILSSSICSQGCKLKGGGIAGIISFLIYFGIAATCFVIPEPKESTTTTPQPVAALDMAPVVMASTESMTQRVGPDGTTIVEKMTTNPDGTTRVETTSLPPV